MVGAKHQAYQHETLETIRESQITPVAFDALQPEDRKTQQKYAIKVSEIFEILKNIPNFTLLKDTKYKMKYAIFGDLLLQVAADIYLGNTEPDIDSDDEPEATA